MIQREYYRSLIRSKGLYSNRYLSEETKDLMFLHEIDALETRIEGLETRIDFLEHRLYKPDEPYME